MIMEPERYLEEFADAGADLICVHAESTRHLERVVSRIDELGCKPAVALNPRHPRWRRSNTCCPRCTWCC